MSQLRKIHLFNCDHIYDLDVLADLINATKAQSGLNFLVEKHYFAVSQMSELSAKIIPELQMDLAFLVVHAYESGLSINEDGLGYAEVYRALLQATEGNVMVVIGGDDNYRNEDEEKQSLISRWARRRIVSSQLKEEFLDGRKSFVFSWDRKHRHIHEEALLHYFDPNKKGQKFEYQPPAVMPAEPGKTGLNENVHPSSTGDFKPIDEPEGDHVTKTDDSETRSGLSGTGDDKQLPQGTTSIPPTITTERMNRNKEPIMPKGKLRHGKISYEEGDIIIHRPGFEVPDYINKSLVEHYGFTAEAVVEIVSDPKKEDVLRWSVDPRWSKLPSGEGKQIASNETLMLKTRVRFGKVSFEEDDLEYMHPDWEIPSFITESLKRQASNGELSVFSDEKGNLRCKVERTLDKILSGYKRSLKLHHMGSASSNQSN